MDVPGTTTELAPETWEVIRKALERSPQPLSVTQLLPQLTGPFKLKKDRLATVLEERATQGEIHRYPRGRTLRYWTRNLEEFAQTTIQHVLQKPRTRPETYKALTKPLADMTAKRRTEMVNEMIRSGAIHELPSLIGSRSKRLCARPAEPREYLADAFEKLRKSLAPAGISLDELYAAAAALATEQRAAGSHTAPQSSMAAPATAGSAPAATSADSSTQALHAQPPVTPTPATAAASSAPSPENLLLEQLTTVEPSAMRGALVSVQKLRKTPALCNWDKRTFDRVVLQLATEERIALHRHDFPGSLSETDRAELVTDDHGNCFIGLALRT